MLLCISYHIIELFVSHRSYLWMSSRCKSWKGERKTVLEILQEIRLFTSLKRKLNIIRVPFSAYKTLDDLRLLYILKLISMECFVFCQNVIRGGGVTSPTSRLLLCWKILPMPQGDILWKMKSIQVVILILHFVANSARATI